MAGLAIGLIGGNSEGELDDHSGDGVGGVTQDLTDWSANNRDSAMVWEVADVGANSNALRWGTLYNYSFTANAGPKEALISSF